MEKTNFYEKYYSRGYRTFDERECLMCGDTFIAPSFMKNIVTCSEYCKIRKLTLQKMKGKYLLCRVCNKPIWCQPKRNHSFCSKSCANIGTTIFTSERNIVRNKYKKYYGDNWLSQRNRARERDNFTCQICGITEKEYGKQLSVHHKVPFLLFDDYKIANKLKNLTSICEPCHRKVHSGKNHPSKYLK